ncbi:MAG: helix-turn-helix domain-containing protein [Myxococcales bacterium]|nr:helix-turn-helix domain-containing protein [Myxococcales bacterium]
MTGQTERPFADTAQHADPVIAPTEQHEQLHALVKALEHGGGEGDGAYQLRLPSGQEVTLPEVTVTLLARIAEVLARGGAVSVAPIGKSLTIRQAAGLLNVSRQHLTRLLDEGLIPSTQTETRRRVCLDDLFAFRHERDAQRMAALHELMRLTQAFGGYDEEFGQGARLDVFEL